MEPVQNQFRSSIVEELEKAEEEHLKSCPEADFPMRLASIIVDGILAYLAFTGIHSLSNTLGLLLGHLGNTSWGHYFKPEITSFLVKQSTHIATLFEISFKVLFAYLYFVISTSFSGGTPGKLLLGLRVVNTDNGKRIGPGKVLLRLLIAVTLNTFSFGLTYLFLLFSKSQRTLHDEITHTSVKKVHGVK
jgi:uncharacterized RDD family membrane protein YckC